jgi:exo-beta-1,3-glucanase (GH17 family)
MEYTTALNIEPGTAICYSGYREGQKPGEAYPSYEQVKEDLLILKDHWKYIRLYDCGPHSETVLKVIEQEKLALRVMLGAYVEAEMNNSGCPWGGIYPEEILQDNKAKNLKKINKLIGFAKRYPQIIFSLSVGNEATVDWTDHYVPIESIIKYVRLVKAEAQQPVTFCENYVPWLHKLEPLVAEIDFISIHTYPVWEYQNILNALEYTKSNYYSVAHKYPEKTVVITEAGWATKSNGVGIDKENVNEDLQDIYYNELLEWSRQDNILTFVFEAFDEPWKGSAEPNEPEKHWGLFRVDRTPKLVMQKILEKTL